MRGIDMKEWENLYNTVKSRKTERIENSHTNYLFDKGKEKILKKIGEESSEVIIAAMQSDKREIINELCDLIYHLQVLMVNENIELTEIEDELQKRSIKTGNLKSERKPVENI